ncbi:MAG: hypothetical protein ACFCU6_02585, partial [Balneolaceae bacterium]
EIMPDMKDAREKLAQAEASIYHKEYEYAINEAYEAAAFAVRLPLYERLVDPFSSEEALWKFETLFVLTGETDGEWNEISAEFDELKNSGSDHQTAQEICQKARNLIEYIENTSFES